MTNEYCRPLPQPSVESPAPATDALSVVSAMRGTRRRTAVCVSSDQLFAGAAEVHIEHRGALYRLQQTSLGKLILTK